MWGRRLQGLWSLLEVYRNDASSAHTRFTFPSRKLVGSPKVSEVKVGRGHIRTGTLRQRESLKSIRKYLLIMYNWFGDL